MCAQGWNGPTCEDVDDCYLTNPCQNGGICVDGDASYTCNCATGFIELNCEEVDDCFNDTCQNGGTCVDGDNSYTCNCTGGFGGDYCETSKYKKSLGFTLITRERTLNW